MCDAKQQGAARGTVLIENERTRVTEWRFAARGQNTGWHRHAHDYVVVPLFDGELELREQGGTTSIVRLTNGAPYYRQRGVEHDVLSANDFECAFIEIEFIED